MKTTIDIPDDLYRRVKAKTALNGRAVRDVTIELFQKWIEEPAPLRDDPTASNRQWLEELLALAVPEDTPGSCTREILDRDRKRLGPGK